MPQPTRGCAGHDPDRGSASGLREGEAFELRATAKASELNAHAEVAAELAWEHLLRRFPKIGEKMLTEAGKYGIYGTGFSKVTVAYDNPTNAHYDDNFGVDVLVVFDICNLPLLSLTA